MAGPTVQKSDREILSALCKLIPKMGYLSVALGAKDSKLMKREDMDGKRKSRIPKNELANLH